MRIFITTFILMMGLSFSYAQDSSPTKDWRIEIEPSSYIFKGFSLHVGKALTKDKKFSLAFYTLATDIPNALQQRIFSNTTDEDMGRVGLQLTLNARYKLDLFKGKESNPYIGLVSGWEYFTLNHPDKEELRIDVILLTPYIGGEIYLYKDIIYVNPQIRSVLYLNPVYSIANREETINKVFLLPQVSIGARF